MGEKFVGSEDNVLHADAAETVDGQGSFVPVPAQTTELDLVVDAITDGPHSVIVEAENAQGQISTIHTFAVSDTTDLSKVVSLGGFPSGNRIRARWVLVGGSKALTFTLTARESRSGLE